MTKQPWTNGFYEENNMILLASSMEAGAELQGQRGGGGSSSPLKKLWDLHPPLDPHMKCFSAAPLCEYLYLFY